jgi:protein TonB
MTAIEWYEPERRGEFARLSVAAMVVVAAHIAAVLVYLLLRPAPDGGAAAPVVDVEFMPPEVAAPAADLAMPEPPAVEPPKEEPPPEPLPQVEAEQPPVAMPLPEQTVPPVEALPPPAPAKPVEVERPQEKPVTVKPKHQPHRSTAEEQREERKEDRKEQRKNAEHQQSGARTRVATAPNPGEVAPGAREAEAGWRTALMARLQRAKPAGTREGGTVELSFTMERSGRVVSKHIARSSGSATLDQAALSMLDRAQPLPAFPPSMREARKTLNLPVRFSVR